MCIRDSLKKELFFKFQKENLTYGNFVDIKPEESRKSFGLLLKQALSKYNEEIVHKVTERTPLKLYQSQPLPSFDLKIIYQKLSDIFQEATKAIIFSAIFVNDFVFVTVEDPNQIVPP
eukprot:TRINITY_DN22566_c0_g1_i1.p1 TRINITY_DN22566_c0_g1~~TRINITY_DN22566_c0_g1_i1.p1  ORF type:complete len:118 (+),score=36.38 TRINITY_DN22566_c0_g1_i1:64-417(+)